MKILGIESASLTASAAVLSDGQVISEYSTTFLKTHSETLLPMAEEILKMVRLSPRDLDAVAVSEGPGSFTGLRIGASMAKGLAYVIGKPIIPVPTLDAMAYGFAGSASILCPILDARRMEVYTGFYEFSGNAFSVLKPAAAEPLQETVRQAKAFSEEKGKTVLFFGDGLTVHEATIRKDFPEALIALPHVKFQRAASVAALGEALYQQGIMKSAEAFTPVYLRMSQAERERLEAGRSIAPGAGPSLDPVNKELPEA